MKILVRNSRTLWKKSSFREF